MRTRRIAGAGAALVGLALAALLAGIAAQPPRPVRAPAVADDAPPAPRPAGERRLYCEFYNFVGRSPKVGFYFAPPEGGGGDYAQIFQREADGSQTVFETRPAWAYDRAGDPPALRAPDGETRINLYGEGRAQAGGWFEAGLRSIQYLNLDGQCRRTES